jgi:hypothetical protein
VGGVRRRNMLLESIHCGVGGGDEHRHLVEASRAKNACGARDELLAQAEGYGVFEPRHGGDGMVVGVSDGSRKKGVEWSNGLIALVAAMLSHRIGTVMQSSRTASKRLTGTVCATREVSSQQWYGKDDGGRTEGMGSWWYKTVTAAAPKSLFSSLLSPSTLHLRNSSHSRTASTGKRAWLLLGSWALKRYSDNAQTGPGI